MAAGLDYALLGTVVSASVLGSLHCAFMCGPLVSACQAGAGGRPGPQLGYQLTRGLSYVVLGALSGAVGAAVDYAGSGAGVARAAAVVSGLLVVLSALFWLFPALRAFGQRLPVRRSAPALGLLGRGLVQLGRRGPTLRASLLGLVTPALPCGYLYAFILSAAGTGSAALGAALMAAFWLGTLPALLGVGYVVGRLSASMRARIPLLTGLALLMMGVLGVLGRGLAPAHGSDRTPAQALGGLSEGKALALCALRSARSGEASGRARRALVLLCGLSSRPRGLGTGWLGRILLLSGSTR
jgi:sulfite exporter TauE/SafE